MSKYECYGDNYKGYIIDTTKIPNYKSREDFEKEALQKIDCSDEDKKDDALTMAYLKWQDYLWDYKLDLQEVCDTLNQYESENIKLKESNTILRANKNDCTKNVKFEREQWLKMDEMRLKRIKFLEKRLIENNLSIYENVPAKGYGWEEDTE